MGFEVFSQGLEEMHHELSKDGENISLVMWGVLTTEHGEQHAALARQALDLRHGRPAAKQDPANSPQATFMEPLRQQEKNRSRPESPRNRTKSEANRGQETYRDAGFGGRIGGGADEIEGLGSGPRGGEADAGFDLEERTHRRKE